ncbi:DUF885 domain-containing protein [Raineyella antarctica]|uniref:DUF885 domain-containing protein n=1 Tax=Raineyella antarctica TaxID=1577474 RepID=UPI000B870CBC|nr:DUF885 domain-containing protein [Raineyella antarctica]
MRQPSAIDVIAEDHVRLFAVLRPTWATSLGIPGHDDRMGDLSPAGHEEYAELVRTTLQLLDSAEREVAGTDAAQRDAVTLAALRDRLGLELESYEAGEYRAAVNNIESPVQGLRDVFDLMPSETAADWEMIGARLADLPQAIEGYISCLREGLAGPGPRPTRRQAEQGLADAVLLADPAHSWFVTFVAGARPDGQAPGAPQGLGVAPGLGDALAARLHRSARSAAEAYDHLARVLRDEVLPGAPEADAVGRERYARFSREYIGAAVDLDETYEWGLDNLRAIAAEQRRLAARIAGPGASVADAVAVLDADPSRRVHGTAALQQWMTQVTEEAITALDGTHFDISGELRRLECRIAPTTTGGIYYTGPSDDWSRPGRMWWSVPPGVEEFSTWRERTTVYHEGVPGHHLQIGRAVVNKDELNIWRRLVCWTSGHGEGWALYAERLMAELGFLDDPGDRFGMLDAQMLRAARVVFDIGVHLGKPAPAEFGGGTWDAAKGWTFLREHVASDEATLRFEWNRYLTWPGQAPSYMVGQRIWQDLRREAAASAEARGEVFSLRDFHARALALGSLPLQVLRTALSGGSGGPSGPGAPGGSGSGRAGVHHG